MDEVTASAAHILAPAPVKPLHVAEVPDRRTSRHGCDGCFSPRSASTSALRSWIAAFESDSTD